MIGCFLSRGRCQRHSSRSDGGGARCWQLLV